GLPGLSIEREVIRDYFAQKFEAGFEYAYLFPGLNRVLQAAGRVIRTENDRGVVFLIDDRFSSYRYRSLLPGEWEPVRIGNEEEAERALMKFW
ncbi:MAG: helicase C-terminal domain-containing protein, partial [Candidatus Adiutricales bacterium]